MADAFRGLTLRLGADARPLNSALESISRSASQAQRQMNLLNKALKFDTTNIGMMQSRLDLMGDKAHHSARSIANIKIAMKQAASETLVFSERSNLGRQNLEKMANSTRDVYAQTQKLRAEGTHLTAELQHIYDAAKKAAQVDFGISWQKADKYVKGLQRNLSRGGAAAERAQQKLTELFDKISSKSNVWEKFGIGANEVDKLTAKFKELRAAYIMTQGDLREMEKVEGFRAMRVQLQAYEAELRQTVSETARFRTEMHMLGTGGSLAKPISQIRALGEVSDKATADAHQMIEAYKAMPRSMDAAIGKMRATKQAETALATQVKEIKSALDILRADPAFDKLAAESEDAYIKALKVEQEYTDLGVALKKDEEYVEALGAQMRALREAGKTEKDEEFQKLASEAGKAQDRIKVLRAQINALDDSHATAALIVQVNKLEAEFAEATTKAAALRSQVSRLRALSNIGNSLREFGFGMYASLTPAIMMAGRYALQAAEDTDKAYRDMRKTVNGTEEDFEHLRDAALEFSRTHVTTAETMLEIEAMGGQLGIQVEQLEAFAHTVSNLDIATNMKSDEIAQDLGKMATVLGMSEDEYDKFGDSLVRLGNNFPAMESDIMKITTRFMGMGKVVGMMPDEMLGWATAATATGQKAEAAGSSMLRFVSNMETAVNGSDEGLQKWADVAGMTVDEFRQSFGEDASQTMYKFVEGMGMIQKSGGSVNQLLRELGINNVRDKQLLEGLANQMANATDDANTLADALRLSNEAYNGMPSNYKGKVEQAGDAMREAERKSEGFSGAMQKMRNQATFLANELAEGAAPIVADLGKMFGDMAGMVGDLPQEIKTLVVELAGLLALSGPLGVFAGTYFRSFEVIANLGSSLLSTFTNLGAKSVKLGGQLANTAGRVTVASRAFGTLGNAIGALGNPAVLLGIAATTAAIGLFVSSIKDAVEKSQEYQKATKGLGEATTRAIDATNLGTLASHTKHLGEYTLGTAKSIDELASAQARAVDSINERSEATETEIALLQAAKRTIDEYMNTDMSGNTQAQGEFAAAVHLVNEKCGTQYEILDLVNGKLADENGNLLKNIDTMADYIDKKQQMIKLDALMADLQELEETSQDQLQAIALQQEVLANLREQQNNADNPEDFSLDIQEAEQELLRLQGIYNETTKDRERLASSIATTAAMMDGEKVSVEAATKAHETLSKIFQTRYGEGWEDQLDSLANKLEKAGITTKEIGAITDQQALDMAEAWRTSGGDIKAVLDAIGLKQRSIGQRWKEEVKDAKGSTELWNKAMEKTGLSSNKLAKQLEKSGITVEQFTKVGADSFGEMYQAAGEDLSKVKTMLDLLDAASVKPKNLKFNAETGQLETAEGLVITIGDEVSKVGEREFRFNVDTQQFEEVVQQVDEADEAVSESDATYTPEGDASNIEEVGEEAEKVTEQIDEANPTLTIDTEEAKRLLGELLADGDNEINATINFETSGSEDVLSQWETLKSSVEGGASGKVDVNGASIDEAKTKFGDLSKAAKDCCRPNYEISVKVTGGALSAISDIQDALDSLTTYKEIEIHTKRTSSKEGGSATGAIFNGRKIPLNAAGAINGIVNHAMLTNIGWVGEAGAEAVMHMRNAGGAVIPLSNRRYVRPFARAVASEMGGLRASSPTYNVSVYLDYNAGADGEQIANDIARALERKLAMEA